MSRKVSRPALAVSGSKVSLAVKVSLMRNGQQPGGEMALGGISSHPFVCGQGRVSLFTSTQRVKANAKLDPAITFQGDAYGLGEVANDDNSSLLTSPRALYHVNVHTEANNPQQVIKSHIIQ